MISIRGMWRGSVVAMLMIGLIVGSISVALAQDQLTDIKPLVGKWNGFVTTDRGSAPADVTVKEDGSYEIAVHLKATRATSGMSRDAIISGAIQVADGNALFKHSDGSTGTVTANVDSKGKRMMKWVRDDGRGTAEYEAVK